MLHNAYSRAGVLAAAAFLGGTLLAIQLPASAVGQVSGQPAAAPSAPTKPASSTKTATAVDVDHVELRIKDLHTRLHITPEQETQWTQLAQVMRDNAQQLRSLIGERSQGSKSMNAVDDLLSYEKIAAAHEDGLKRFIPPFQALYASMPDAQQKNADTVFRTYQSTKRAGAPS